MYQHAPIADEQQDSLPLPFVHKPRRDNPHETEYPAGGGDVAPIMRQRTKKVCHVYFWCCPRETGPDSTVRTKDGLGQEIRRGYAISSVVLETR